MQYRQIIYDFTLDGMEEAQKLLTDYSQSVEDPNLQPATDEFVKRSFNQMAYRMNLEKVQYADLADALRTQCKKALSTKLQVMEYDARLTHQNYSAAAFDLSYNMQDGKQAALAFIAKVATNVPIIENDWIVTSGNKKANGHYVIWDDNALIVSSNSALLNSYVGVHDFIDDHKFQVQCLTPLKKYEDILPIAWDWNSLRQIRLTLPPAVVDTLNKETNNMFFNWARYFKNEVFSQFQKGFNPSTHNIVIGSGYCVDEKILNRLIKDGIYVPK